MTILKTTAKKFVFPAICGTFIAVILAVALLPIAEHIHLAVDQLTHVSIDELPEFENLPQDGIVDLSDTGGYPFEGEALGHIQIDGTAVNCTLYYGDGESQIHAGVGIWKGGKIPGENGTVLVAGHTNSFFRDLESVKEGADILVQTRYGEYHYRVTGTKIAQEDDTSAYDLTTTKPNMILYTCYPFGQVTLTSQRYFVYAEFVSGPEIVEVNENAAKNG